VEKIPNRKNTRGNNSVGKSTRGNYTRGKNTRENNTKKKNIFLGHELLGTYCKSVYV